MPTLLRLARRTIALAIFFALMSQFSVGLIPVAKAVSAQTKIVEWNFPDTGVPEPDAIADGGIAANDGIKMISTNATNVKFNALGSTTKSAWADGWDGAAGMKYWQVEFETTGYDTLKLSSKQSGSSNGPNDFKVEYSTNGLDWSWLSDSLIDVNVYSDWSGALSSVSLPTACDNQSSVYLRWKIASTTAVDGGTTTAAGANRIDDILVTGTAVAVDYSNVYVDDDDLTCGGSSPCYSTIQAGIADVDAGGTVNVAAGTYNEDVLIEKALTLNGANANISYGGGRGTESILQPATSGAAPISLGAGFDGVTINGFEITGPSSEKAIYCGVYGPSDLDIKFNYIHHVGTNRLTQNIHAISYRGGPDDQTNINISDNYFNEILNHDVSDNGKGSSAAIWFGQSNGEGTISNVTIQRNTINNVRSNLDTKSFESSPYSDVGKITASGIYFGIGWKSDIYDGNVAGAVISENTITNIIGGIAYGIQLSGSTPNIDISNNEIADISSPNAPNHAYGIGVPSTNTGTGIKVNNNKLTNTQIGVINGRSSNQIDAENNWWGSLMGPASCSDGSKVSGPVDYSPWFTDSGMTTTREYNVQNTTASSNHNCIQEAIDAAHPSDTIEVLAGTYLENYSSELALKIDKAISLVGDDLEMPVVDADGKGKAAQVTADNVSINGLRFTGATGSSGIGVYLFGEGAGYSAENEVVTNCDISGNYIGLFLAGANGATIENNTLTNNTYRSIVIQQDSDDNIFVGNTISMSGADVLDGVLIGSDSGGNTIGTEAKPNTISIPTTTSHAGDHLPRAIYLSGIGASDNTIQFNTIDGSASSIQIDGNSGTTTVDNNTIGVTIAPSFRGVQINGGNLVLTNNLLKDTVRPVEFWGAGDVTMTDNTLDGTTFDFINFGSFTGTVSPVEHNSFLNMGTHKFRNQTGTEIDAEYNYWGSAAEPSGKVSGAVDYDPWFSGDPDDVVSQFESTGPGTSFTPSTSGIDSVTLNPAGNLSIVEYSGAPTGDAAVTGFSFAGNYYDIDSDLTGTFTATIVFSYPGTPAVDDLVGGVLETDLRASYFDGTKWVVIVGTVDPVNNTYTFTTNHFTAFSLVGTNMDVTATDNFAVPTVQSGATNVGILDLVFTNSMGSADTLEDIVVTSKNLVDGDVANVRLFEDDGDGIFEPTTGDTLLDTVSLSGGFAPFIAANRNIPTGGTTHFFVAYTLNFGLTGGNVLDASIAAGDIILTTAGTNVEVLDPAGETVIDDIPPTVTLTDDDADYDYLSNTYDGLVKAGDTVTFTANFNEAMSAPTISITSTPCSDVTNAPMTDAGAGMTWTYSWAVPACSDSSDPTILITVSGADTAGNAYAGSDELNFIYDNTAPALTTIKGTDAGPVQSDTIQIKIDEWIGLASSEYNFSSDTTCGASDFTAAPTAFTSEVDFAITGDHTDYLCARAIDDAGHISYLRVGQLNTDDTTPTINGGSLAGDNSYLDVSFSEGIFGQSSGAAQLADLRLVFSQGGGTATDVSLDSIFQTDGTSSLIGGETAIRANLTVTGTPDGNETVEVLPTDGSSLFDQAGNAMLASETTGAKNLNDKTSPVLLSVDWNDKDSDTAISGGDEFVLTFSEPMNTTTIRADHLDDDLGLSGPNPGSSFGDMPPSLVWNVGGTVLTFTSGDVNFDVAHNDTVDPSDDVKDAVGNPDNTPAPLSILDGMAPVLTQVTPVTTPTSDDTPDYEFHTTEAGTIVVGGSCKSADHSANVGNNALILSNSDTSETALPDGTYSDCTVTVTDAFGNVSDALAIPSFTIDTGVPTLTTVSIISDNPTTTLAKVGDDVTVSFTSNEGIQDVFVSIDGNSIAATNPGGNDWKATRTMAGGDSEGVIAFEITFKDLANNSGTAVTATSDSSSVTFDETAPTLDPVSIASDNANDTSLAKVGDTVTVSFESDEALHAPSVDVEIAGHTSTSIINTSGNLWEASYVMQTGDTEGSVSLEINYTDLVGNNGVEILATNDCSSVYFDKTVPIATIFSPADDATEVAIDTNLVIIFDENMKAGMENILIKKSSDDSTIATIPVSDPQVSFSTNIVTIDPTADLPDSTSIYVEIPSGALTDFAGNPFAGISDKSKWNFMTVFGANGGNIITLEEGWNVFSTPRELSSIEFFNGGTNILFYKLEGGTYASTTTPATIANVKPLEGFLVNNTSGAAVDVYLDYADGVTGQGLKVFNKTLPAGWNLIGIADQLLEANDIDYTEILVNDAFVNISNTGSLIDYTTPDFAGDDNSNKVDPTPPQHKIIDSNSATTEVFEEFKAYLLFVHQGGTTYGGNQEDNEHVEDPS